MQNINTCDSEKKNLQDIKKNKIKRAIFIIAMIIVPMMNFFVFYLYVNLNSILMAFRQTTLTGETTFTLNWFKMVIESLFVQKDMLLYLGNTMKYFAVSLLIIHPLTLAVSYFIYKKIFMYKFFRVMFFIPQILSAVVLTTLYKNIIGIEGPIAPIIGRMLGLEGIPEFLTNSSYATPAIIVYCVWTGFGTSLILFLGAMARIPEDVIEAGELDGVSCFRELVSIILPLVWPTFTTLTVMTFMGIFTSSGPILLFTKGEADTTTIAYYIFQNVYFGNGNKEYAAAVGLFFTVVSLPIILGVKTGMERWQDAIEY